MPKLISTADSLEAGDILDDVEASLEAGIYFSFPGKQASLGYYMRRLMPGFVWKAVHKTEGF